MCGVLCGRCLGLGAGLGVGDVGEVDQLLEQLELVAAPVRRVGDDHLCGGSALPFGRHRDHPREESGRECLGGEGLAADHDRDGVADPAFELAGGAGGVAAGASVRGLAEQERAVGGEEHDGRHGSARFPKPSIVGPVPSSTAAAVNVVPRSTPSR